MIEKPGDVQARLVALIVVGTQASECVYLLAARKDLGLRCNENIVQPLVKLIFSKLFVSSEEKPEEREG